MKNPTDLTENKRRIITLLKKKGPLSKGEISLYGDMGWATVVKIIGQLSEAGIVKRLSTINLKHRKKGKRAYLYGLMEDKPLAVGVDVEYRTTSIVLTNLNGDVLAYSRVPTINSKSDSAIQNFLFRTISKFLRDNPSLNGICGVGIGIPGIGFPSNNRLDNIKKMSDLELLLSNQLHLPVRISDNTKAYAVFEKWNNETFPQEDFIFLSVRTGVGTGIFYSGNLYLGTRGLAGEIGHIQVVPNGKVCRCGNRGCMETLVGQRNLYREYCSRVIGRPEKVEESDPDILKTGLADLFTRARRGEPAARSIIEEAAEYLGRCLGIAIMVLDVPNVVVSGHFGKDGEIILEPLETAIRKNLLPGSSCAVKYLPFDPQGHVQGAALLILKDYFIDMRTVGIREK